MSLSDSTSERDVKVQW